SGRDGYRYWNREVPDTLRAEITGANIKSGSAAGARSAAVDRGREIEMTTATESTTGERTRDDRLQALIRLIAPARALKEDLEKSVHLELFSGTGDNAVKSVRALQASAAQITNDPFLTSVTLDVPDGATDKEKVSLASLGASQLAAYLMGQTGVSSANADFGGGGSGGN